ncbi:MAG: AAA family ATPase, partial [Planctomycetota bacterium]
MYLKKLLASGFKSFADPIEFHFHPGTTAIVGPNGCGKSNIVDAFRWVLGERSAKGLRGQEMLDVIFTGTRKRPAMSRAEVTLVFDNSDGKLPLEFAEVEVSRRLFRSGESEYLINRRRCRLKDIYALFADTGIGTEGYSILEQGSVDSFLNSNKYDRRVIFEEAAGISRYKKQAVQSLSQLERVEANVERLGDLLREVERQLRSVKIQAGKARRYLEDRELWKRQRAVLATREIGGYREERQTLTFKLASTQMQRELIAEISASLEQERNSASREVEQANQILASLRDEKMKLRMSQERISSRCGHIEERRQEMQEAARARSQQREELLEVESEYGSRREKLRSGVREQLGALRDNHVRFDAADSVRRELQAERGRLSQFIRTGKEQALSQIFAETRLSNEKSTLESEARGLMALQERRQKERAQSEAELAEFNSEKQQVAEQRAQVGQEAKEAGTRRDQLATEIERRSQLLGQTQETLSHMREKLEKERARLRFLEGLEESLEGVGKGAQRLLSMEHPLRREVLGLLARAIEADPEVAPMLDAVLGPRSEAVLFLGGTPLEDRARILAELLDGEGVTFCQVDGRQVEGLPAVVASRTPPSEGRLLLDLIRFEPMYRPLFQALLGDVLVVENLEEALVVARKSDELWRFVTPEGRLLEPWGAISLPARHGIGLVSRRSEIAQLVERLASAEKELVSIQKEGQTLEAGIEARREGMRCADEESQRCSLQAENLDRRAVEIAREMQRRTQH